MNFERCIRRSLRLTPDAMPPQFIEPCHPTSAKQPPTGPGWLHEIKWDGYRVQVHLRDGNATVYTRRHHEWTAHFAPIAAAVVQLKARSAILDGEAVVLDTDGKSDFQRCAGIWTSPVSATACSTCWS